jgi:hypothetical protein
MLKNIVTLYHRCIKAVTGSSEGGRGGGGTSDKAVTWNVIKTQCAKAIHAVTDMKFKDPRASDAEFGAYFTGVSDLINATFDVRAPRVCALRLRPTSPANHT